jgi:hypothetical protein
MRGQPSYSLQDRSSQHRARTLVKRLRFGADLKTDRSIYEGSDSPKGLNADVTTY